jgi:glycerophosphoryl diester phosphodiesterase
MQVHTARVTAEPTPPRGTAPVTGFAYLDEVLDQPGSVIAMAHRGGALHPDIPGTENTLHAFRHAVAQGYRYLETDVHVTSDGVLLAFHDAVLDRVTDLKGRLSELTADQVSVARIREAHPVPTMAELLEEFPDARFNIDLKAAAAVRPLAELLTITGSLDRVCIGSFSLRRLDAFRRATGGRVATSAAPQEVGLCPRAAPPAWPPVAGSRRSRCRTAAARSRWSPVSSYAGRTPPARTCTSGPWTSPTRWTSCSTSGSTD